MQIAEVEFGLPSAVQFIAPRGGIFQPESCFGSAVGSKCIDEGGLKSLHGHEGGPSAGRNSSGLVLVGNDPLRLLETDGEVHVCSGLPDHPIHGDRWTLDQAWLSLDSSRIVVAAGGTQSGSAAWISYDDCRTWTPLPTSGALVGARITSERVLGLVARGAGVNLELDSLVFEAGTASQTRLQGRHTRVAIGERDFWGFGQGVARYFLDSGTPASLAYPEIETVAGCENGPTLGVDRDGGVCRLSALLQDGGRWWSDAPVPCDQLTKGSLCAGGRLFVSIAGVLVEVRPEGLRPLPSDSLSTETERAILHAGGVRYFTADGPTPAVARMSWDGAGWTWEGVGTRDESSSLDAIEVGEFELEIKYDFIDSSGGVGYLLKSPEQQGTLAALPLGFDTGLRRLPPFRQVNTPQPGIVFPDSSCFLVTVEPSGARLGAWPCDPSGTLRFHVDIVADPEVQGRWLVNDQARARDSLLVEDFGGRVTSLGRPGVFVFDQAGEPLLLPDADVAATLMGRRGYWAQTSNALELRLFDGRSWSWPSSRLLGISGATSLVRTRTSLVTITTSE